MTIQGSDMELKFTVQTDHFQFFLADEDYSTDTSSIWTDEALDRQIACGADLVAVGTARYGGETSIVIEIKGQGDASSDTDLLACTINIVSGVLVLFSPESDFATCPRLDVTPGAYKVFVAFEGLESVRDEEALSGDDQYRVILKRE
jgi:hypothetical protein